MEYLKSLPKSDLLSLLEIVNETRVAVTMEQFQKSFRKTKELILFDAALGLYADKESVDQKKVKQVCHYALDFSDEFLRRYARDRYYERSSVFQSTYQTWRPQHWKTVWREGIYGDGPDSMQLAQNFGYMDGWSHAVDHSKDETFSFFAFCGKQVENNQRTSIILNYLIPHFAETLKDAFHADVALRRQILHHNITKREMEVLRWIESGKTSWEISCILHRSERVIKWHTSNILQKLGAMNRTQAIAIAARKGIV
jgi:DNA-binding CsgD family transcriptional regulator